MRYDLFARRDLIARYGLIAIAGLLALSGCAGGLGATPPDTYGLGNAPVVEGRSVRNRQLLIAEPNALKALDSEQIVIRPTPSAIEYLARSQWSDRLPKVVQDKIVQAFENTGKLGGVGRPGEGLAIDFQLVTSIRSFEINAYGGEQAVVEISAKIVNDRNGVVISQQVFSATAGVSGAGNSAYVQSLDRAFDRVVTDMVEWTLSRVGSGRRS